MIKGLAFVAYAVRDVPKATAFYRDVVGLAPGDLVNDGWAELTAGTSVFGLDGAPPPGMTAGASFSATFEVDDIEAERARLQAAAVDVGEVHDTPVCRVAFVTDPDGNRFGIHQRKST